MSAIDTLSHAQEAIEYHSEDRDTLEDGRSMGRTVAIFGAITGIQISEEQGWIFQNCVKLARSQVGPFNPDDYVDGAAYWALAGEAAGRGPKELASGDAVEGERPTPSLEELAAAYWALAGEGVAGERPTPSMEELEERKAALAVWQSELEHRQAKLDTLASSLEELEDRRATLAAWQRDLEGRQAKLDTQEKLTRSLGEIGGLKKLKAEILKEMSRDAALQASSGDRCNVWGQQERLEEKSTPPLDEIERMIRDGA